jgi:hypothetical protein
LLVRLTSLVHLHLFGARTPSGEAFRRLVDSVLPGSELSCYSRRSHDSPLSTNIARFEDPASFLPAGDSSVPDIWISFGPIWLLAPFLERLATSYPERLSGLCGLVACSSSSVITKRFAANRFDKELIVRLASAEDQLLATCRRLDVRCHILRPTLIYGQVGPYGDRNFSQLLRLMRRLPLIPIPSDSGLRQPIHASQLASVALHLVRQLSETGSQSSFPERIDVGGDSILDYQAILRALQQAQSPGDPACRCLLLPIPNRLFFSIAAPLLIRSPKAFEAVMRMSANLSGFTPAHQFLGREPQPFPVMPLA